MNSLPVEAQKPLHLSTPSRRHEKDEAELLLERPSAHQGSRAHSPVAWSPTSYWKLNHTHIQTHHMGKLEVSISLAMILRLSAVDNNPLLPSHSLLAMVFPSWPIEQIDVSLSTLVTLALRPPCSCSWVFVSEDGCRDGLCSTSKNTFEWPWILSAKYS